MVLDQTLVGMLLNRQQQLRYHQPALVLSLERPKLMLQGGHVLEWWPLRFNYIYNCCITARKCCDGFEIADELIKMASNQNNFSKSKSLFVLIKNSAVICKMASI